MNNFISTNLNEFISLRYIRKMKVFRNSDELQDDERIVDPIEKLKIETFYISLDIIITELQTRFNNNQIDVLRDLTLFSEKRILELNNYPTKLLTNAFQILRNTYIFFIN